MGPISYLVCGTLRKSFIFSLSQFLPPLLGMGVGVGEECLSFPTLKFCEL